VNVPLNGALISNLTCLMYLPYLEDPKIIHLALNCTYPNARS